MFDFRPRVGMGWFTGFNPERFQKIAFFVPAWGWVGSFNDEPFVFKPCGIFVPEWGWVASWQKEILLRVLLSSSPLGDGLVHILSSGTQKYCPFSSPLGDELVPTEAPTSPATPDIFVPAWGWVGSHHRYEK